MLKVLIQIGGGLLASIVGLYVGYLYLVSLTSGGNIFFLLGALFLIGTSIFLFLRSSKSDATIIAKPQTNTGPHHPTTSILERNNEMIDQWNKVNSLKTKLKTVQITNTEESQSK